MRWRWTEITIKNQSFVQSKSKSNETKRKEVRLSFRKLIFKRFSDLPNIQTTYICFVSSSIACGDVPQLTGDFQTSNLCFHFQKCCFQLFKTPYISTLYWLIRIWTLHLKHSPYFRSVLQKTMDLERYRTKNWYSINMTTFR